MRVSAPSTMEPIEVGMDQYQPGRSAVKRKNSVKDSSTLIPYSASSEFLDDALNESIGSEEGDRRSAYKSAANPILPVIPEKGDASKILRDKSLLRYGNGINKRKTAASQSRLAVENAAVNSRY